MSASYYLQRSRFLRGTFPGSLLTSRFTALLLLGLAFCLRPPVAQALTIGERVRSVYNRGNVRFSCLMVDGGAVPMNPPSGARMTISGGVIAFIWPEGKAEASLKNASPTESSLIDKNGKSVEQPAWESAILSQIDPTAIGKQLHDFQPDIMPINHWKMGVVAYDYQLGGTKWTTLLLVWRCQDGTSISVKLFSQASEFENTRNALYQIIGGSMLLEN